MRRLGKYVGGGEVGADKYGTVSSFSQGKPPADVSEASSASPRYVRKSSPGMERDSSPDEYRKGGAVKKPTIKRYQHGGVVNPDTGPGAASASSHRWSANIKGRDVTMKAKGGKITNLRKGKR